MYHNQEKKEKKEAQIGHENRGGTLASSGILP
jgi:hypothetical protein